MQLRRRLTCSLPLFAVALIPHFVTGQNLDKESPSSVVIVELFTSEGCSSCPPADALLRQVNLKQTRAGQLIVGISEHVTYWNHLGCQWRVRWCAWRRSRALGSGQFTSCSPKDSTSPVVLVIT